MKSSVAETISVFDRSKYETFFERLTTKRPFDYQTHAAELLTEGRNVLLRAPTGAGKTWTVVVPSLWDFWQNKPNRLIYALPLRTLAQGIYAEAKSLAEKVQNCQVTLQTGEQPDDPFFTRGNIIVTTYDQVLSGLLESPYGLSRGLHNVNAAAVAGALVVFDEFHLMPPDKGFLTAVAGMYLFRGLCQSAWMTATATPALQAVLKDALGTEQVPGEPTGWEALLQSLPSVTTVRREIVMEPKPLTTETVLGQHRSRSIVLFNQVRRAQQFYLELFAEAEDRGLCANIILLHSRFFKGDRHSKEEKLRHLFGKGSQANAILISTQVIEAGIDISCEHLHTELCPMNALVQRAGRCARFEGEQGTVHVYPLPDEVRAWLPYGDQKQESETLASTRALLDKVCRATLNPSVVEEWVAEVHQDEDETALRQGWSGRLTECLRCVENIAIHRQDTGVAQLIRGDHESQVRLILSRKGNLPLTPGKREAVSIRRESLFPLLNGPLQPPGWSWDLNGEKPTWKPLETASDLVMTYVICLKPDVAAYDEQIGLRVGEAGDMESPSREEPQRPGHSPLHKEPWADHASCVAKEAQTRLHADGWPNGLLFRGLAERYNFNTDALQDAVRTCALLHDLGKLQEAWQRWAEAAQKAKDKQYQHVVPLAHTDFDPEDPEDWKRERHLGIRRPPHSAASAYYGLPMLSTLLRGTNRNGKQSLTSACLAAILAHHGGWLPPRANVGPGLGIMKLTPKWNDAVAQVLQGLSTANAVRQLEARHDKLRTISDWLALSTDADNLRLWWPLVAYLTRTLRLSDQRATREGSDE